MEVSSGYIPNTGRKPPSRSSSGATNLTNIRPHFCPPSNLAASSKVFCKYGSAAEPTRRRQIQRGRLRGHSSRFRQTFLSSHLKRAEVSGLAPRSGVPSGQFFSSFVAGSFARPSSPACFFPSTLSHVSLFQYEMVYCGRRCSKIPVIAFFVEVNRLLLTMSDSLLAVSRPFLLPI